MQATDRLVHAYQSLEDEYFRERHSDIEHVAERILLNLSGDRPFSWEHLSGDQIIVVARFQSFQFRNDGSAKSARACRWSPEEGLRIPPSSAEDC